MSSLEDRYRRAIKIFCRGEGKVFLRNKKTKKLDLVGTQGAHLGSPCVFCGAPRQCADPRAGHTFRAWKKEMARILRDTDEIFWS